MDHIKPPVTGPLRPRGAAQADAKQSKAPGQKAAETKRSESGKKNRLTKSLSTHSRHVDMSRGGTGEKSVRFGDRIAPTFPVRSLGQSLDSDAAPTQEQKSWITRPITNEDRVRAPIILSDSRRATPVDTPSDSEVDPTSTTAEFGSTAQPGALLLDLTSLIDQDFNASTMRIISTPSTTIGKSPTSVPREKPDGRSGRIHIADGPATTNKFKKIWSAISTPRTKRAKTKKNKLTPEEKNYRKNVFAKMEGYFVLCQVMRGGEQTIGKKTDAGDNLLMTVNATIHDAAVYLDQPTQALPRPEAKGQPPAEIEKESERLAAIEKEKNTTGTIRSERVHFLERQNFLIKLICHACSPDSKANIGRFVIAGLMYSKSIEMPEAVHILLGSDRAKAFLNEISIEQLLQNVRKGEAKSSDNVQVMKTALLKHAFAISLWLEFIRDGKPAEQHNSAELGAMKKELNRRIADSHLFGGEETKDWLADRGAKIRSLLGIGDDADNFIDELRKFIYPLADHERLAEYSENRQNLKDRFDREQRPSKEGEGSNFIFQDKGES